MKGILMVGAGGRVCGPLLAFVKKVQGFPASQVRTTGVMSREKGHALFKI